jgi:branched-chain amino acid transport system substrate-binding protein
MGRHRLVPVVVAVALVAAACSEQRAADESDPTLATVAPSTLVPSDSTGGTTDDTTGDTAGDVGGECVADTVLECVREGTTFAELFPEAAVVADGEPIKIGMVNNETGPAAAFPELTLGTRAGVDFVNRELGGVDGRPIELITCDVEFSATGSQACGQQMVEEGVVAVIGGIDLFDDAVNVLEENGIPYVGGIPVSFAAAESPLSFQFSGGSWGQNLGLVSHMVDTLHAERVSIIYGEFGSVSDGAQWAREALIGQGVAPENINMVPMPIVVEDVLTPLTVANESDPDAILVLVADAGCAPAYEAVKAIGITAQTYWSAGCLLPSMIEQAGEENVEGFIYGFENPVDGDPPDTAMWTDVVEKYGADELDAGSAALVEFRALMNLWAEMRAIGGEAVSSEAIVEQFRSAVDHPGFLGHSYTCDGQQMAGALPAICSPQQILGQMRGGALDQISDWVDVGAIAVVPG